MQCLAQGGGSSCHLSTAIFCLQSNCERGELPLPELRAPRGPLALLLSQASISRSQVLSGLPPAGLIPSTLLSVTPQTRPLPPAFGKAVPASSDGRFDGCPFFLVLQSSEGPCAGETQGGPGRRGTRDKPKPEEPREGKRTPANISRRN